MAKPWKLRILAADQGDEQIEIRVYDDIGLGMGPGCVTTNDVLDALQANPTAKRILLRINSSGGLVSEATSIVNLLRERAQQGATIEARIDGIAASAAAYLTTVADRVVMPDNAFIMIHKARAFVAGTDVEMEIARQQLVSNNEIMAEAFAGASARRGKGKSKDDYLALMDAGDRYFRADEAIEWGLADEKTATLKSAASMVALTEFAAPPPELRAAPYVVAQASLPLATPQATPPVGGQVAGTAGKDGKNMDLKVLAKMLGLPETATEADVTAALTKLTEPVASAATPVLRLLAAGTQEEASARVFDLQKGMTALLGCTGKGSQAEALVTVLGWKAGAEQAAALSAENATLKTATLSAKRDASIEKLSREGKLAPSQHEWARSHFPTAEALESFALTLPPMGSIGAHEPPDPIAALKLTADEKNVCKTLGIAEDMFLAEKKLQIEARRSSSAQAGV